MKRRSANRWVWCCGGTLALCGCAQIAGLTGDYQVGVRGGAGGAAGTGNVSASGGDAGTGAAPSGGDAGASGDVGTNAGSANGGTTNGGSANGGSSAGGAVSGGSAGTSGGSAGTSGGSAGTSGSAGVAGTGGAISTAGGPVFIAATQFHDSASGSDDASGHLSDATFDKPAGTAQGDFLLAFFGVDHDLSNITTQYLAAEGWTLLDQKGGYGGDGQGTYLMYKFASATEPATIVFTAINTQHYGVQGLLSAYRGVNKLNPINDYQVLVLQSGADVAHVDTPTPAVTTTVAHCLVITGLSPDTTIDAPLITAWPLGFDENQVSVINPAHPFPNGWANIYAAERHVAAAGKVAQAAFGWDITVAMDKKYYGSLAFTLALAP